MTAVATRPRVAKAKPAPVTSPVADILARIDTSHDAIRAALSGTDETSDLWTMLFGIDDNLMPYSLAPLYRTPVSKADVGEAYDALLFTLAVLKAALMMSKGLVMEAKLQEAFEILNHAHNDMDSALVQHWPIPDGIASIEAAPAAPIAASKLADSVHCLPFETRDRLGRELYMVRSAVMMLITVFAGNGPEVPKETTGLMGSMQYVNASLARCKLTIGDAGIGTDGFYFGVFHASSLAAMLEDVLWADSWDWSSSDSVYCDLFSAIQSGIEIALNALDPGCVSTCGCAP